MREMIVPDEECGGCVGGVECEEVADRVDDLLVEEELQAMVTMELRADDQQQL